MSSSTFSLSIPGRVRSLTKLWSTCANQAGLINYKPRFWSYTAYVLLEMLSETYFSVPFGCNMRLFDTSWPLYRFLFQNRLWAKTKPRPTRGMSAHQQECLSVRCSATCTLVVVGFLSFEHLFPFFSGHVAPISKIFASFYSISSPLLCKGQLSHTSSTKSGDSSQTNTFMSGDEHVYELVYVPALTYGLRFIWAGTKWGDPSFWG